MYGPHSDPAAGRDVPGPQAARRRAGVVARRGAATRGGAPAEELPDGPRAPARVAPSRRPAPRGVPRADGRLAGARQRSRPVVSATAIDTNILLYALNASVREHLAARRFLDERRDDPDTVISELVLVELYVLLRTAAVVSAPLSAPAAAALIQHFRRHPSWQLVDH